MTKIKLNSLETKTNLFCKKKLSSQRNIAKENKLCEKKLAKKIAKKNKNKTEPFAKQPHPHAKKKGTQNMQKKKRFNRNLPRNRKSFFIAKILIKETVISQTKLSFFF